MYDEEKKKLKLFAVRAHAKENIDELYDLLYCVNNENEAKKIFLKEYGKRLEIDGIHPVVGNYATLYYFVDNVILEGGDHSSYTVNARENNSGEFTVTIDNVLGVSDMVIKQKNCHSHQQLVEDGVYIYTLIVMISLDDCSPRYVWYD